MKAWHIAHDKKLLEELLHHLNVNKTVENKDEYKPDIIDYLQNLKNAVLTLN